MARTKKRLSTVTDYGDDDVEAGSDALGQLSDMIPTPRTDKVTSITEVPN